jgi:uncharacterized protein YbjT (DUF2867 family)
VIKLTLKIIGGILLILVLAIAGLLLTVNANLPTTTFEVQANAMGQAADDPSSILIFGGTRNTGLLVAQMLTARGDKVTAFVRPTSDRSGLEPLGVDFVVGDAMDMEAVEAAFAAGTYRAVVTTIGCLRCNPPSDYQANANIINAAKAAGVKRVLLVTTIGAGDSYDAMPWLSKKVLARTLPLKTHAEEDMRRSGLDYTIIRPGGLRTAPPTGNGVLTEEVDIFGFIFREDLAGLIVAALDDERAIGKTLAAVDANRQRPWSSK